VSTVNLSGNPINSELIVMLKRQKGLSKYLKKVVMKGAKVVETCLKKEGISAEQLKEGKVKIGDVAIVI
jgi:hypothetical protein